MPLPDALLALATVGTAHNAGTLPPAPAELAPLLAKAGGPPEAQMLLLAAALALREKAGRLPLRPATPLPAPSAPDERPLLPAAATGHLRQMLGGEYKEALPEWLAAANERGLRPPDELLPALLDLGLKQAELRPLLFPFLGPRAAWLAEQAGVGPWAYWRLDDVETVWQEAEAPVRAALLAHLRWRDPARGRELLDATWSSEGARQREAFLRELDQGLSSADEPFLKAALDDRSGPVRAAAAYRLARLPGSAFVQRMAERASSLVSLQRGWRGTRLSINEKAAAPEASWERDGLDVAPPQQSRMSAASLLLRQLLSFVPPDHWQRQWQLKPVELLEVARRAPEELSMVTALGWSAARAGDGDFGLLLVREALAELPQALLAALLPLLPAPGLNAALLPAVQRRREPFEPKHPAVVALMAHAWPWSPELAAAVLDAVSRTVIPAYSYVPGHSMDLMRQVARCAPPADGPALVAALHAPAWKHVADELLATLDFRRRMLTELEL